MTDENTSVLANLPFWLKLSLSAISGVLLAASMPGYDILLLGWIALVPMLVVVLTSPVKQGFFLA